MTSAICLLVLLTMTIAEVSSRECYQCQSSISYAACDLGRVKVRCLDTNQCVKGSVVSSNGDKAYVKACAKRCDYNNVQMCVDGKDSQGNTVNCTAHCCTGDYCNSAPQAWLSGFFVLTCVLAAMNLF
ncbi:uncharacterized protein LOC116603973 isoform X2 [Nematostella vectensis]|uniref:uncharacterized protein LOC116603973 isoform X2 n=1 Tax=Nematostella vectensis TaxID=45351 RepID=UPI00207751DE|nr:uncharacterized protein LOC116603973 isoform X2 [Nematostella vectensis]